MVAPNDSNHANGHVNDTRPAPPPPPAAGTANPPQAAPASSKAKPPKKQPAATSSSEHSKLVQQRISQLELDAAGEKDMELEIEKEVRKANRELHSTTQKMDAAQKIELLTQRHNTLTYEAKKQERESYKQKKRADLLQKERDQSRSELTKTVGLKDKLEKLCRELQKENNKLKSENRQLKANELSNLNSWDEKYAKLLQKLDDLQEQKDHPKRPLFEGELDDIMRAHFKSMMDQYELRELHFNSMMRTKELEVQFNMARYEREKKRADREAAIAQRLDERSQYLLKKKGEAAKEFSKAKQANNAPP